MTELSDRETLDQIAEVIESDRKRESPPRVGTIQIKSMNEIEQIITHWRSNKIDSAYSTFDGCCMVVDIAANLQKELDECNGCVDSLIKKLDIRTKQVDHYAKAVEIRDETVRELKRKLDDVSAVFDDQNSAIEGIEAELSARKEDSEVLMKVVEAVREYDGSYKHGTMNTFNHVYDILVDYLDAPEGPPDTPIDENHEITITYTLLE